PGGLLFGAQGALAIGVFGPHAFGLCGSVALGLLGGFSGGRFLFGLFRRTRLPDRRALAGVGPARRPPVRPHRDPRGLREICPAPPAWPWLRHSAVRRNLDP